MCKTEESSWKKKQSEEKMCKTAESSRNGTPVLSDEVKKLRELVTEQVNLDINAKRSEYFFKPPAFIEKYLLGKLQEQRDAPLAYLLFNMCVIMLPSAALQFCLPSDMPYRSWLGLAHLAITDILFAARFILTLHFSEHRKLFSKRSSVGNALSMVPPYVIAPFMGIPSGMYNLHHVVMHHLENNVCPHDVSSTECFQRDNILHFLFYWMRYTTAIWFELPYYAYKRDRMKLLRHSLTSAAFYMSMLYVLYGLNPMATKWVFMYPYLVTSFALMFGNWSQHIFVDPENPRSSFGLTYNCVNCPDNQKTYNDGYHVIHHVSETCHWSEMPQRYLDTMEKHSEEDALAFRGLGFFEIGILAFAGQLGFLADRMMDIRGPKGLELVRGRTREEKIELLKHRLQPINFERWKDARKTK